MKFFPLVFSLFMFILITEPDRAHPLHVHGDEPHHRHRLARAARVLHRHHLRLLEERPALPQAVRAERHPDLHPAADRVHRDAVVPRRARSRTACVCSPTCWPATSRCKVFASFVTMLGALGVVGWFGATLPLAFTVALYRARAAGRVPAGLRLRHPHLHLSQRRASSRALRRGLRSFTDPISLEKELHNGSHRRQIHRRRYRVHRHGRRRRRRRHHLRPVTSPARCAIRRPRGASSAT